MFEYINDNLFLVLENIDKVLFITPYEINNKEALFAALKLENGIYSRIQITKEMSKRSFPINCIGAFHNGPGHFILKDFINFDGITAFNSYNIDNFKSIKNDNKLLNIDVYATFNDGSNLLVTRSNKIVFDKVGGIDSYNKLLKSYKDSNDSNIYPIKLEDNDIYVISELSSNNIDICYSNLKESSIQLIKKIR